MDANKEDGTALFIDELEIQEVFGDEDREEGAGVMDNFII